MELMLFVLFFSYVGLITTLYGIQPSISDSYYIKRIGNWFVVWCFAMATLLMATLANKSGLVLFPSFGFCVVGLAPKFEEWMDGKMHLIGAITIIAGGLLMIVVDFSLIYSIGATLAIGLFILLSKKLNNRVFWIELLAFVLIFIGIKFF
jgi:hypothetical protein